MEFEPKPFGKYFLVDKLAIGGMAEIYKAKTFGVDGFEKLLAIKKILPHYSADKEFIAMLTDEAKLVVRLSHTNIVQIYDLGKVGDDYYISMEFIEGINLRELINRGKELGEELPVPVCLYIISEVAKGLDYAHGKRDEQGRPLNIVHRDISPQNILISFEGETKIVDFGIAKAAMNISQTSTGMLKGKISYMSPEQALGKTVDQRTDIFSTGIMLYELLTGEKLFTGETQFEVLKNIRSKQITEKTLPENLAPGLRRVLATALAYLTKNRYETAGDLQVDLTKMLYSQYPDFAPKQLGALIKRWFGPELKQRQKQHEPSVSFINETKLVSNQVPQESIVHRDESSDIPNIVTADTTKPENWLKPSDLEHSAKEEVNKPSKKSSWLKRTFFIPIIIPAIIAMLGGAWFYYQKISKTFVGQIVINTSPDGATIYLDGKDTNKTTPVKLDNLELKDHIIRLEKEGYEPYEETVSIKDSNAINLEVKLKEEEQLSIVGSLILTTNPPGASIFFDGQNIEKTTPFTIDNLELNKSYELKFVLAGYKDHQQVITLTDEKPLEYTVTLEKQVPVTGTLQINSDPVGASITLNGKETGKVTPTTLDNLKIPQDYVIELKKEGYLPVSKSVTIDGNQTVTMNLALKKEITTTKINVSSTPSGAKIFLDGADTGKVTPTTLDKINFPNDYEIKLVKEGFEDFTKKISASNAQPVIVEATLKEKVVEVVKVAHVTVTSNITGAQVTIDKKSVGVTPGTFEVKSGKIKVQVSKTGYETAQSVVNLKPGETKAINLNLVIKAETPPDVHQVQGSGQIRIDSKPRGAAVVFDGKKSGSTPIVIKDAEKNKSHTIVVSLPGYKTWTQTVNLKQNSIEVTATLQKE